MGTMLDPDTFAAAAHANMAAHLVGPFAAGAIDTVLAIDANGRIDVPVAGREPVLLIAPAVPLGDRVLIVEAVSDPDGARVPILPPLRFDPYTEAGACLPLHVPAVDADTRLAAPFSVALTLHWRTRDDEAIAGAPAVAADLLQARLLEGVMGKLIYALSAEKLRLRRQLREILAMRALGAARWDALDRIGADLGVPRFADRLRYDAATKEVVAVTREQDGKPVSEPDAQYRRRLALYYRMSMPTPANALALLNGSAPGDTGPIAALGAAPRLTLEEHDNPFAIAIHVVAAPGNEQARQRFFDFVGRNFLVWPAQFAANDPHAARLLSSAQRNAQDDLRAQLRAGFRWSQNHAIAPALATALARLARVRTMLGVATKLEVKRAFSPASGSRYELGHGVDLVQIPAAELDAMHQKLRNPATLAALDASARALVDGVVSRSAADDPLGRWLLESCGVRTVHRLDASIVYLSSLPTDGLVVVPSDVQPNDGAIALEAHYHAEGDPGANAVLESALRLSLATWTGEGGEAWTRLAPGPLRAAWQSGAAQPDAARRIFAAAGLAAPAALTEIATALDRVPGELIEGIKLGPVLSARITAGDPAAAQALRRIAALLTENHASALLPFASGPDNYTIVVGAIGLPLVGINLSDRRATGFRWYAVPIDGDPGEVAPVGARTRFRPAATTLSAVVALGYVRRGATDPYEFRAELPKDAMLNLAQYEFLMNALARLCPLGVQANTYDIRQRHVDLDGNGRAEPLASALARTYRKFHRPHRRGESAVGAMPASN